MAGKYTVLFNIKLREYVAYRMNFILWRVRNIFHMLLFYFLWQSVFRDNTSIGPYSAHMMFTYIFVTTLCNNFILRSRTDEVGGDILYGNIANLLLKPMHYFWYIGTKEGADKVFNMLFTLVELTIVYLILQPPLLIQSNINAYAMLIVFLLLGIAISFFIGFALALMAFWSAEIWAPRFIFFVFISLLAGNGFPIDILPDWAYYTILLTPFPYLIYVPTKTYIFGITHETGWFVGIAIIWLIVSYRIARTLWHKGLREFSFYGR